VVGVCGTWRVPGECRVGLRECLVRLRILPGWVERGMGMDLSHYRFGLGRHEPVSVFSLQRAAPAASSSASFPFSSFFPPSLGDVFCSLCYFTFFTAPC